MMAGFAVGTYVENREVNCGDEGCQAEGHGVSKLGIGPTEDDRRRGEAFISGTMRARVPKHGRL